MSKTVLVTGAARGIGAAIVKAFAKKGYAVVINYHTSDAAARSLEQALLKDGTKVLALQGDMTNPYDVERLFETVEKQFGGVDILINNAGIASIKMLCDVSPKEWDKIFSVNVDAAYLCSKRAYSHMVRSSWGRIINISSMWGICGASCEVPYSASKAALIGFTKSLAKELAPCGVTVNAIAPGLIDTDMNRSLSKDELDAFIKEIPVERIGEPEEIAYAALFLADEKAGYITGQTIAVDGGMT